MTLKAASSIRALCALLAAATFAAQPAETTKRVAVGGGTLVLDVAGAGPTIVLLHGAFLDRRTWDAQMPALAAAYRVVRYDIRPFGESTVPDKPYAPGDDLTQVLDSLSTDTASASSASSVSSAASAAWIVGHSFGGSVAVDFALDHPKRVAGLVLVNSGASGVSMPPDEQKAAGQVFAAARESDDKGLEAWLALELWSASRARPEVMRAIERGTRPNMRLFRMSAPPFVPRPVPATDRLGEIRVPTLIVTGDRDTPGNIAASELLARGIPGAKLLTIAGADHAIPIGWGRELNDAVLSFLAKR